MGPVNSQNTNPLKVTTYSLHVSGSLDQLSESRTPPTSLKIRTFSIAEQEEQEAASGTHDRRVSCMVMVIKIRNYFVSHVVMVINTLLVMW